MKKIFLIAGVAFMALTTGCTKEQTIGMHLGGDSWKITAIGGSSTTSVDGVAGTPTTPGQGSLNNVYAFDKESTGVLTMADGDENSFFWSVDEEVLTIDGSMYLITEDSSKKQVWTNKGTYSYEMSGKKYKTVYETNYTVEKQ